MANTATVKTDAISGRYLNLAGPNGKSLTLARFALVLDGSSGAAADDLPASLFGFTKLLFASGLTLAAETAAYATAIDATGDSLLIVGGLTVGVGSTLDAPAGTYHITLIGY